MYSVNESVNMRRENGSSDDKWLFVELQASRAASRASDVVSLRSITAPSVSFGVTADETADARTSTFEESGFLKCDGNHDGTTSGIYGGRIWLIRSWDFFFRTSSLPFCSCSCEFGCGAVDGGIKWFLFCVVLLTTDERWWSISQESIESPGMFGGWGSGNGGSKLNGLSSWMTLWRLRSGFEWERIERGPLVWRLFLRLFRKCCTFR